MWKQFKTYSVGRKIFTVLNYCLMAILALICLIPIINVLATSLRSREAAESERRWKS